MLQVLKPDPLFESLGLCVYLLYVCVDHSSSYHIWPIRDDEMMRTPARYEHPHVLVSPPSHLVVPVHATYICCSALISLPSLSCVSCFSLLTSVCSCECSSRLWFSKGKVRQCTLTIVNHLIDIFLSWLYLYDSPSTPIGYFYFMCQCYCKNLFPPVIFLHLFRDNDVKRCLLVSST